MKIFRTTYQAKKAPFTIDYGQPVFLMGSCFSSNISDYLTYRKFKVLSNPYGILFNPIAVFRALEEIIELKEYTKVDLVEHHELQHSLSHHSNFSGLNKDEVLHKINQSIQEAHVFLKSTAHLIFTFGTAWVYTYEGAVVANCHKIPNHKFEKRLLSIQEIEEAFEQMLQRLQVFNPELNITLTISPVRHLRNGFVENNLSKSILRTAIYSLEQKHPSLAYFPSYEIMMDDLRDYRFYESDMLHPNKDAINYIWEQFVNTYLTNDTKSVISRIEKLQDAIHHRPRFEQTEAYQKHLAFIEREKLALKQYF